MTTTNEATMPVTKIEQFQEKICESKRIVKENIAKVFTATIDNTIPDKEKIIKLALDINELMEKSGESVATKGTAAVMMLCWTAINDEIPVHGLANLMLDVYGDMAGEMLNVIQSDVCPTCTLDCARKEPTVTEGFSGFVSSTQVKGVNNAKD